MPRYVPKSVASGTRFQAVGVLEESSSWRESRTELFGTDEVKSLSTARVGWQGAQRAINRGAHSLLVTELKGSIE